MHLKQSKNCENDAKKSVFGEKPTYLFIVYHKTAPRTALFFVYLQIIYKNGEKNGVFLGKSRKKEANAWHRRAKISIR